jgi:hypothetical protein
MPMNRIEELEYAAQRDRRNMIFTLVLVVAAALMILLAWRRS